MYCLYSMKAILLCLFSTILALERSTSRRTHLNKWTGTYNTTLDIKVFPQVLMGASPRIFNSWEREEGGVGREVTKQIMREALIFMKTMLKLSIYTCPIQVDRSSAEGSTRWNWRGGGARRGGWSQGRGGATRRGGGWWRRWWGWDRGGVLSLPPSSTGHALRHHIWGRTIPEQGIVPLPIRTASPCDYGGGWWRNKLIIIYY